jgi:hypothetical protein
MGLETENPPPSVIEGGKTIFNPKIIMRKSFYIANRQPSTQDTKNSGLTGSYYVEKDDGTLVEVIDENGEWVGAGSPTGDITAVTAGAGLTGGGTSGAVTLNVANTDGKLTVGANTVDITADSLVNADINTAAAIAWSKMAALTSNNILAGVSNVPTVCTVAGDISLSAAGTTATFTVTDLTIASEAQGDILYRNATNWVRLAPGTSGQALVTSGAGANPYWGTPSVGSASSLANNVTCEAGGSDYTLDFGTAGGAYTLTVPAVGGSRTFAFINEAQNFSANQTFDQTTLLLKGGDANTLNIKVNETLTGAKTLNIKVNDTDRTIDLGGNLTIAGSWTHSGAHTVGITTQNNGTFAFADATAYALTFPTGTDVLVGRASTDTLTNKTLTSPVLNTSLSGTAFLDEDNMASDAADKVASQQSIKAYVDSGTVTFTNKTIDADGTGNTISNINMDELDPVVEPSAGDASDTVYVVTGKLLANISNQAAAVNIYNSNAPFKFKILKAWSINKSGDGGTWKLNNGAAGAGTDITNAVTVAANDQDYDQPTDYDDSVQVIASGGSLSIVPDGAGLLDCDIVIEIARIA